MKVTWKTNRLIYRYELKKEALSNEKFVGIALAATIGIGGLGGLGTFATTKTHAAVNNQESTKSVYQVSDVQGEFMHIKVGKPWSMTPSGKQYKYVLFSENKIYVNPKTGVVTAYEEGAAEGRVLDKMEMLLLFGILQLLNDARKLSQN